MRGAFVVSISIVLAACGDKSAAPAAPIANASPPPPPFAPVYFDIDGTPWVFDAGVPVTYTQPDEGLHRFTAAGWMIDVAGLPGSKILIQTLEERLEGEPARDVLYQHEDGPDAWAAVIRLGGRIHGAVKIHGQLNVLCSFNLADDADWHAALDACGKVKNAIEEVEPGEGD